MSSPVASDSVLEIKKLFTGYGNSLAYESGTLILGRNETKGFPISTQIVQYRGENGPGWNCLCSTKSTESALYCTQPWLMRQTWLCKEKSTGIFIFNQLDTLGHPSRSWRQMRHFKRCSEQNSPSEWFVNANLVFIRFSLPTLPIRQPTAFLRRPYSELQSHSKPRQSSSHHFLRLLTRTTAKHSPSPDRQQDLSRTSR